MEESIMSIKIQTVCGFGCGSSLMLRMIVENHQI